MAKSEDFTPSQIVIASLQDERRILFMVNQIRLRRGYTSPFTTIHEDAMPQIAQALVPLELTHAAAEQLSRTHKLQYETALGAFEENTYDLEIRPLDRLMRRCLAPLLDGVSYCSTNEMSESWPTWKQDRLRKDLRDGGRVLLAVIAMGYPE